MSDEEIWLQTYWRFLDRHYVNELTSVICSAAALVADKCVKDYKERFKKEQNEH